MMSKRPMTEDQLIAAFEAGTPPEPFHHVNHVKLAWIYMSRHPILEVLSRLPQGLKALATARQAGSLPRDDYVGLHFLAPRADGPNGSQPQLGRLRQAPPRPPRLEREHSPSVLSRRNAPLGLGAAIYSCSPIVPTGRRSRATPPNAEYTILASGSGFQYISHRRPLLRSRRLQ